MASREEGIVIVDVPSAHRQIIRPGPCGWADWSPSGDRIAASCGGRVGILDRAGTPLYEYPDSGTVHGWSPNGSQFAFTAWRAPLTIFDGAQWFGLDTHTQWFRWLAGGELAFVSQPDETSPLTLSVLSPVQGFPIAAKASTRTGAIATSVSPDGKFAAYGLVNPESGRGSYLDGKVILLNMATGEEVAVFTASAASYPNAPLEWSPDGTGVLVQTDVCKTWNLAVAGIDRNLRQVASGGFWVAKFSPDGKEIGFTRGTELWVVPADGTAAPRLVATGIHGPAGFEWSPDGKWLAVPDFFGGFGACE